jgi:hypothetical protein
MAWGAKISATQLTSITTEQFFDQSPTLNPRESAHCHIQVDFPATPTDDAVISVFGSFDARAGQRRRSSPWCSTRMSIRTRSIFIVRGVYQFRVGIKRSGSTNTLTSADFAFRKNGANV